MSKVSCDLLTFWNTYDSWKPKERRNPEIFVRRYRETCTQAIKKNKNHSFRGDQPTKNGHIRFVVISDTHCRNKDPSEIPHGDVLLHCGDSTMRGFHSEFIKFNTWMGDLHHTYKIVIAGNHDRSLEVRPLNSFFNALGQSEKSKILESFTNFTYIEDETITIHGYNIYGSPWTPVHLGGFQRQRGVPIKEIWSKIPENTDILMTHGPPAGVGDLTRREDYAGCVDLLEQIQRRVKPLYHVFGHIHEGNGVYTDGVTTYINAALCDVSYKPLQPAYVFDLPIRSPNVEQIGNGGHGELGQGGLTDSPEIVNMAGEMHNLHVNNGEH